MKNESRGTVPSQNQMKQTIQAAIIAASIALASCSNGIFTQKQGFVIGNPSAQNARIKVDTAYAYSYDEVKRPSQTNPHKRYYLDAYQNAGSSDRKKEVRNEILFELMAIIDEEHAYAMEHLRRYRGHAKMTSKLINVGAHVATATNPGAQTISVLSAIGAGATSMDDSIDSAYLQDSSLRAIVSVMEAEKVTIKTKIRKESLKGTDLYTLQEGFTDLKNYWEVGFLHKGVALLEREAAVKAQEAKDKAENKGDAGKDKK